VTAAVVCIALVGFPVPKAPPAEMLIRLSVQPAAAPRPALRYLLLPEIAELEPGNPVAGYLRVLLDQDFSTQEETFGPAALRQVDRAARLDKPDWQLLPKLKTDGISLLLPDLQKMRALAAALQSRFREEVAQHRYDDALTTAKTMFALARHTGEHPTLIGSLVGIAIAYITIAPLEELLEQPGVPNLYWALTDLPAPLVSIQSGLAGERILMRGELRDLKDKEPMTEAQIAKVMEHIEMIRKFEPDRSRTTTKQWVLVRARDPQKLEAARNRLVDAGHSAETLAKFPAQQVILLDELREFEVRRDNASKVAKLPAWQYEQWMAKHPAPKEPSLLSAFEIANFKVHLAQARLEQRIALLRHVEAIRMFAAEHDGRLPSTLDDIEVPLPIDPMTGKPFKYAKDGEVAHLRGTCPKGHEQNPAFNLHYEITIRK
jgi:hypothetical protein